MADNLVILHAIFQSFICLVSVIELHCFLARVVYYTEEVKVVMRILNPQRACVYVDYIISTCTHSTVACLGGGAINVHKE